MKLLLTQGTPSANGLQLLQIFLKTREAELLLQSFTTKQKRGAVFDTSEELSFNSTSCLVGS